MHRPNGISWSFKKKPTVAKSSTEVKYHTITTTTSELLWLRELLNELGHPIIKMTLLFYDNIRANYLYVNPLFHK